MTIPLCRHCGIRPATRSRQLCHRHYEDRAIRDLYPSQKGRTGHSPEMTEEEVELLVAEQSKPENLPSWFHRDAFAMQRREQPVEIRIVHDTRRR